MRASHRLTTLVFGLLLVACCMTGEADEVAGERDARMAWWRDAKFGMFIHWGLYAVPAGEWKGQRMPEIGEWIMSKSGTQSLSIPSK